MRRCSALLVLTLTACSSGKPGASGQSFDPVQFFAGHTQGDATLHILTGSSRHVAVDSNGIPDGHGGLVLDQTIREQGSRMRTRRWVLHPAGSNRWSGTLTDADGRVRVERTPANVVIHYRMKNGTEVEQRLQQDRAARTVSNHMTVSRFGVRLATLDERIRKLD